jgi:hypothetical protein
VDAGVEGVRETPDMSPLGPLYWHRPRPEGLQEKGGAEDCMAWEGGNAAQVVGKSAQPLGPRGGPHGGPASAQLHSEQPATRQARLQPATQPSFPIICSLSLPTSQA